VELTHYQESSIQIITGDRGVGKSTYCLRRIEEAIEKGWKVAGLLSIALIREGEKLDIEIEDVKSGKKHLLASRISNSINGPRLGPWFFDEETIKWGNELLMRATPCDLLVVDELGILEFDQKQGFISAFDILDQGDFQLALVVIRPEYLDRALSNWPRSEVIWINQQE